MSLELAIAVEGKVVKSNLPEFREMVAAYVATINTELATDEQFGQAEQDVKKLQLMEEAIDQAKDKALRDADEIYQLMQNLSEIAEIPRQTRLALLKRIESQKKAVRAQMIADALNQINCAPSLRLKSFGSIVENAIKGKRTLDSMNKALGVIIASLNKNIDQSRAAIKQWELENGESVPDADALAIESAESVALKLAARTQARKDAIERKRIQEEAEAERKRIQAEAQAEREKLRAQMEAQSTSSAQTNQEPAAANIAPIAPIEHLEAVTNTTKARQEETESQELERICNDLKNALLNAKSSLLSAKHAANIEKIEDFRKVVNEAFLKLKKSKPMEGGDA